MALEIGFIKNLDERQLFHVSMPFLPWKYGTQKVLQKQDIKLILQQTRTYQRKTHRAVFFKTVVRFHRHWYRWVMVP